MNIVILERNSVGTDISIDCLKELGEITVYPNTVLTDTAEKIKDADIIIANKAPMNEQTLKDAKNVKLICEFATGYDNVDVTYCKSKGIKVANVVDYSSAAVAQHTFALALFLLEHLPFYDEYVKSGAYASQSRFSNFDMPFFELSEKTWGIIGLGNIGKAVAKIAEAFGCKVIYYSASGRNNSDNYERVELDTILEESDILSVHSPLTDKTRGLLNLDAFKKMKKHAVLVNVARGPIVNENDLCTALTEGYIAAAGLDVLGKEPITKDNPLSKITDSKKLIITPHMAWASTEARCRLVDETYKNIQAFINGENRNIVNI